SRQALYREAEQVVEAVNGAAAEARIDELRRELAERRAEVQALQERLRLAVEITPEKHHEFAAVAQAEGVSLSVARRLLRVAARDGATWAGEFARFPALRAVVRDDGTGLGKGMGLDNARRRDAGLPEVAETLDVFPTLREGGRALWQTWGVAWRALDRADAA